MEKVAMIFGGTKGIGIAVAKKFLLNNYSVAVLSRNIENVKNAEKHLKIENKKIEGMQCDITNREAVQKAMNCVEESLGPLDVVVNASGINLDKLFVQSQPDEIKILLETNLLGPMISSSLAARSMMKRRNGSIINIGSIVGLKGNAGQTIYSTTKSGLVGFTKSLAKELATRGIRINLVVPGFIETDMTAFLDKKKIQKQIPLKRIGKPEEVAEAVFFLSESSYITGEVLVVDGGLQLSF